MPFVTRFAIAVALAMDAFAVALATGICLGRARTAQVLRMAAAFGLFQALMPVAGWLLGLTVRERTVQVRLISDDRSSADSDSGILLCPIENPRLRTPPPCKN